ncbi:MAG: Gfo/Idh/MocA family oxidoreductase [Candidatus Latescibacterota bacterium]
MALKLIHAGVGGFGAGWTLVCGRSDEVEVVALVDVDRELVEETGKRLGIRQVFTDLGKAIKNAEADALLDSTPPAARTEVTGRALGEGLHVLSEKPLAVTLEHAKGIVRAAAEADRVYMVSQNYRYNPVPRTIRSLMRQQTFGAFGIRGA